MSMTVREVMTDAPIAMPQGTPVQQAAAAMRDQNIGTVIVLDENNQICGLATDRDLVIRGLAERADMSELTLEDVCSGNPTTVGPDATIDEAKQQMQREAVRRLPVVEGSTPVGIVSLGDLAPATDVDPTEESIAEASPDR